MAIDRDKLLQSAAKLVEKKKYDKAILEYRKIVQQDPRDARTLLKIGDLQSRMQDFKGAVATYDRVATYYAAQGFQLKAIAVFKQIREIIRKHAPELAAQYSHVTPRLADIYAELNLVTDALAAYDEVATSYQRANRDHDAIAVFEKTVVLDPKNPLPHLRLAEARCRVKELDLAIDSFWTAAELLLGMRRPDDALKVIERILQFRAAPQYARAAAELYLKKGDQQSGMLALARLQVAFQANPKDLDTLALLAQAFDAIQQPEKALEVHLEMARLARDQKRGALWGQIMDHLRRVAPGNDQVQALEHAGPPPNSQAAPPLSAHSASPGSAQPPSSWGPPVQPEQVDPADRGPEIDVDVVEDDEVQLGDDEVTDLDDDVEYIEDDVEPGVSTPSSSSIPASRPPSVSSPSLRGGELMDAVDDDDDGVDVRDSQGIDAEEHNAPQSFQPASHAHRAILEATQFQTMGLLDKAVEALHIALEIDPNSIPIREKLREILVQAGEREPAIVETINIAIIHIHNQQPDEAEALAVEVLQIEPDHPEALNILDHVAALREARGSVTDEGVLSSYDMEGVRASAAFHDVPPAPAVPQFEEEDFGDEPPVSVRSRSGISTSAPPARESVAGGLRVEGSSSGETSPQPGAAASAARPDPEAIEEVLEEAEFFAAQGLYSDAIAILTEMLEQAPTHVLLQERLNEVRALASGAEPEGEAAKHDSLMPEDNAFDIAASLDALDELDEPATRPALHSSAQEVDVDQVFAKFKEGVKAVVDDSDASTHYDLGVAYKEMGLLNDAIAEFQLASQDPSRSCMCWFMIGSICKQQGDTVRARNAWERGLASELKTSDEENGIEYELAVVLQSEGAVPQSIERLKNIARRDPNYRDVAARLRALGEALPEPGGSEDDDLDAAFDNLLG